VEYEIIYKSEIHAVKKVTPLEDYRLLLEFRNGEKRIFDVKPLLEKPNLQCLKDPAFFNKIHVIYGSAVAWSPDLDMCPDALYEASIPIGGDDFENS